MHLQATGKIADREKDWDHTELCKRVTKCALGGTIGATRKQLSKLSRATRYLYKGAQAPELLTLPWQQALSISFHFRCPSSIGLLVSLWEGSRAVCRDSHERLGSPAWNQKHAAFFPIAKSYRVFTFDRTWRWLTFCWLPLSQLQCPCGPLLLPLLPLRMSPKHESPFRCIFFHVGLSLVESINLWFRGF